MDIEKIELTEEQKLIVNSQEDLIIEARAGTGKTFSLIRYAIMNQRKSKIYIVFNRSIQQESEIKFNELGIKNIKVMTLHALAYRQIVYGSKYPFYREGKKELPECKIPDLIKLFNLSEEDNHTIYKILYYAEKKVEQFCNSDVSDISEFSLYDYISSDTAKTYYLNNELDINKYAFLIWKAMDTKSIYCTHSFYVKKYQLSKPILKYDIIMVDECLPYNSKVLLADGTTLPIGQIVENKLSIEVLTYNEKTKKQEINKIVNWSFNATHNKLYKIIFDDRFLECSYNHKIYVSGYVTNINGVIQYEFFPQENRWVEASELKENYYCQMDDGSYKLINRIDIIRFNQKYTYDITVENNHNFYANGVLVHNCQDLNPVMIDIFVNQKGRKIAVGDTHQAIYGWRGAVNSIKKLPFKKLYLTNSFRFHQGIADEGLKVLSFKQGKEEGFNFQTLKLIGKGVRDSVIKTRAIISRSNFALLLKIIQSSYKSIYIEGGLDSIVKLNHGFHLLDLYFLHNKRYNEIKNYYILNNFKSLKQMAKYYNDLDEPSINNALIFFELNDNFQFDKILEHIKSTVVINQQDADMVFSTIHKSKGKEWDHVILLSPANWEENFPYELPTKKIDKKDYESLLEYIEIVEYSHNSPETKKELIQKKKDELYRDITPEELNKIKSSWCEELNIYYVAVTRAKKVITHDIEWLKTDSAISIFEKPIEVEENKEDVIQKHVSLDAPKNIYYSNWEKTSLFEITNSDNDIHWSIEDLFKDVLNNYTNYDEFLYEVLMYKENKTVSSRFKSFAILGEMINAYIEKNNLGHK